MEGRINIPEPNVSYEQGFGFNPIWTWKILRIENPSCVKQDLFPGALYIAEHNRKITGLRRSTVGTFQMRRTIENLSTSESSKEKSFVTEVKFSHPSTELLYHVLCIRRSSLCSRKTGNKEKKERGGVARVFFIFDLNLFNSLSPIYTLE